VKELVAYQRTALLNAKLKYLGEGEGYAARIPGFKGLVVFGDTKAQAIRELKSALAEWVLLSLRLGDGLPKLKKERPSMVATSV
jgi:predicted RNase H-like HicB family nuclease